ELSDLAAELPRYADSIDGSPGRLDEANERLAELTSLVRDLGALLPGPEGPAGDVTELLEASRSAAIDLDRYDGADQEREESARELEQAEAEVEDLAAQLSAARREAAQRLSAAVQTELVHLEMPDAQISVEVTEHAPRSHGRDAVAILLAPHPGAQHRPVARTASGGELSRVMLALEVALTAYRSASSAAPGGTPTRLMLALEVSLSASRSDRSAAPVFVFDEIDAGIGGRAALAVGQRLARLARHAQVIVVTHLPQVAAHAGTHLQIVKTSQNGATRSTV